MRALVAGLYRRWHDHHLADAAAALTYWGVLSLFPFLIFLVAMVGLLLDPTTIDRLLDTAARFAPAPALTILRKRLESLAQAPSGGLLTAGLASALWVASEAVGSLGEALNRAYGVRETRPFWRRRALAIVVTVAAALGTALACGLTLLVPVLLKHLPVELRDLARLARYPVAGVLMIGLWDLLYWVLPARRPRLRLLSPGALIGVVVWLLASSGFSTYVARFGRYERTYGTLGGIVILLVWMWLSSMVLLLGAELNALLDQKRYARPASATAPWPSLT